MDPHRKRDQERLLSIFAMVFLILALLGGFIIGMIDGGTGLAFGAICAILGTVLGILSWRQLLSRFVVIGVGVCVVIAVLMGAFFLVSKSDRSDSLRRVRTGAEKEPIPEAQDSVQKMD